MAKKTSKKYRQIIKWGVCPNRRDGFLKHRALDGYPCCMECGERRFSEVLPLGK